MSTIVSEVASKVSSGNKKVELQERINKSSSISPEDKKLLFEELNGNQDQFTKAHAELEKRSVARQRKNKFVENCAIPSLLCAVGFSIAGLIRLGGVAISRMTTLLGLIGCGGVVGFAAGSAICFGGYFFDKVLSKQLHAEHIINDLDNSIKNYREHHI